MLECRIADNYKSFCQKNTAEQENASSVKKTIIATLSGAGAIAGAVGSYFVAGPSGVRFFLSAIASGFGGGGVGAAINAILPSRWTNTESFVGRTIRYVTSNFNEIENILLPRIWAITNEVRPRNNATTPSNVTNSNGNTAGNTTNISNGPNDPVSRVWSGAKSIVFKAINSILHYPFLRRN